VPTTGVGSLWDALDRFNDGTEEIEFEVLVIFRVILDVLLSQFLLSLHSTLVCSVLHCLG